MTQGMETVLHEMRQMSSVQLPTHQQLQMVQQVAQEVQGLATRQDLEAIRQLVEGLATGQQGLQRAIEVRLLSHTTCCLLIARATAWRC